MSIADAPARNGATLAINLAGKTITYVRMGEPIEDLTTGEVTPVVSEKTVKAVETKVEFKLVDGSKIQITDRMFLIAASAFEEKYGSDAIPSTDDRIKVGDRDLAIILVDSVSSGEQWALHKAVVSR